MAWLILLRRPYKLTLLVSDSCNLRCQICSIWGRSSQFLTVAEVAEIWAAFPSKPCWINISGGEPTLNPELEKILLFFVSLPRALLITLTTNGQIDLVPMLSRVIAANQRSSIFVSISLDGKESVHDAVRGRRGSYAKANRTLQRLQEFARVSPAVSVGISTTISRANLAHVLPFVARRARELPVSVNLAQSSEYYGNASSDRFSQLPAHDLVPVLRALQYRLAGFNLTSFLKVNFLEGVIRYLEGRYKPIPCASIFDNVLVTADLNLVDCTLRFRRWHAVERSRSDRMRELTAVIHSPLVRRRVLREQLSRQGCERTCHTPCEAYVHLTGALFRPLIATRLVLTYLRRSLEAALIGSRCMRRAIRSAHTASSPTHFVSPPLRPVYGVPFDEVPMLLRVTRRPNTVVRPSTSQAHTKRGSAKDQTV